MASGDVLRASSNMRSGSTSFWRNNDFQAFRRSSREEDEEEALKWASLPTLTSSKGDATEIDILQKKNLIERLIDEDNGSFLLKLKNRFERVGIDLPSIEVRFEHLSIEAAAHVGLARALPTLSNFIVGIVEDFFNYLHILPSRKKPFCVLNNVSGIIKQSRMTLLLGPPSSGKTTLLLALAGKLDPALKVSGRVTYNGHDMHEFVPQRTAAYISQHDLHIGELTVRETLEFSARCQGVGSRYDMLAELLRREKASNIRPDPDIDMFMKAVSTEGQAASVITDYTLKILGLEVCADTMVGDEMLRGISGGQRKRVTTGEMLVGPAKALFMDEISTGLDCSTTFQIVKSLKQSNHILNGTAIISLLQPAPETYDLFDDIILLSSGHIVYQGPREQVLDFFEYMGFRCPERKGVADFLQQVTSKKDQEQFWAHKDDPYRFVAAKEFAEAFHSFHGGQKLGQELAVPYDKTKSNPGALTTNKHNIGNKELLRACASREYLLVKRNSFVYIFRLSQLTILAMITMTVFLRTEMHRASVTEGGIYLGALFITLSVIMFDGFAELSMTIAKLPIFYKQKDLLFYPCWAYALSTWILQIPIAFLGVSVWVFITYFVIGYDYDVGRLFRQYLLLLLFRQMASGLFRLIAALGRNMVVATTFGFLALVILYVLGGFVLSREDINKWWIWGYWISPLMYGQNAIAANEFLGKSWGHVVPNTMEPLGVLVLKSRGLFTHAYWYWLGVGALVGYVFVFNFFYALALTYLNPYEKPQAFMFEESEKKEQSGHRCSTVATSEERKEEMRNQGVVDDKLVLLKGVSGAFRPGVLTALMGVSGAGKTTLMDVLAGRKTGGYIQGNIKISGYPKKQETFARISGYCEQNDIHSPHVTVFESLLYSAWLRLPQHVDKETREMFIEEVMELVELSPLGQSLVGLPGVNGLSTEQRKRLTIAVELVANPSIIFMDEPTSGLDARAAAIVMRTVRNTVDTGRTVVCTIHQPSIDIFEAFDELFLMKRGGQEIYVGPLGHHSCHLIEYFEGIHGVGNIKDGYNPATWMLEVTSSAQELVSGVDFADIYKNSDLFRRNKVVIQQLSTPPPGLKDLKFPTQYSQPFFTQCMACLWKQHCSYRRNPTYTAVRFLFSTAIALLFGTIFWKLGSKISKKQHLFNAMGSMFAALSFIGPLNAIAVLPVVSTERTVFYREKAAGMYSAPAYAFAQVAIELPYIFVQAVVYGVLVYAMIGFEWTVAKFFWYVFFMFFTLLYFTFYGMMAVAVTPNPHIASIVCTLFFSMWSLFSGFLIPRTRIPVWRRWYSWACPVAWTLYGLFTSQYGHSKQVLLDTDVTVEVFLKDYFGFQYGFLGVAAAVVVGIALLFGLFFAAAMNTFNFQNR